MYHDFYSLSGANVTLYIANKEKLQDENYAELLSRGEMYWWFCHDDDEHMRFESDPPIFNGRDHNFEPLGTISQIRPLYPELEDKFHHPTHMVVLTKEDVLGMLNKIDEVLSEEQYLLFNNHRLRDYLNAIEFDDNTIIVGLINDGYHEEEYGEYY